MDIQYATAEQGTCRTPHTHDPLLRLVNEHPTIKAGLLLIRVLCIRQEMLGKLHLIGLELANHHHGNEPTSPAVRRPKSHLGKGGQEIE